MYDSEIMQIPYCLDKLNAELLHAVFIEDEVTLLYVVKKVLPSHVL